jgi:hypothetical protein
MKFLFIVKMETIKPDPALVRTFDGKPLPKDVKILKQVKTGHALCLLNRKRIRGFCVKCIGACNGNDYKKILTKIETYCPACTGGPWICLNCFDLSHSQ